MSKKELKLQTEIVKSLKKDGGYAHKRSHQYSAGIVDLLLALPSTGHTFIAEVKDLGEVVPNFSRKIDLTALQGDDLKQAAAIEGGGSNWADNWPGFRPAILVGLVHEGRNKLVYLPHTKRLLKADDLQHYYVIERQVGLYWDIVQLMGVPYDRFKW